jgi:beta-glucosidase-like glycosyl hydrolase
MVLKCAFASQFLLGRFDPVETVEWYSFYTETLGSANHTQIAIDAALQSSVLLKNDNRTLPLKKGQTIAVLGPQAIARYGLLDDYIADEVCALSTLFGFLSEIECTAICECRCASEGRMIAFPRSRRQLLP